MNLTNRMFKDLFKAMEIRDRLKFTMEELIQFDEFLCLFSSKDSGLIVKAILDLKEDYDVCIRAFTKTTLGITDITYLPLKYFLKYELKNQKLKLHEDMEMGKTIYSFPDTKGLVISCNAEV